MIRTGTRDTTVKGIQSTSCTLMACSCKELTKDAKRSGSKSNLASLEFRARKELLHENVAPNVTGYKGACGQHTGLMLQPALCLMHSLSHTRTISLNSPNLVYFLTLNAPLSLLSKS